MTPSDIAPACLTQQQIDTLQRQYADRRYLAADPAAAGPALPRQHHTGPATGDLYAVQLDITVTGPLDPHRLRDAVHTVINRHPNLAARFCNQFDEPVQVIPADPADTLATYRRNSMPMSTNRSSGCAPPNAPRSATSPTRRPSGWR